MGIKYGTTLHAASLEGHQEVVKILLDKGADVNTQGGFYGDALQAASKGGHQEVIQILLDKGAKADVQHEYGSIEEEQVKAVRLSSYLAYT